MAKNLSKSFLVVIVVALITGIAGLVYGYYQVNQQTISEYMRWVKPEVMNPIQFVRVSFMHNASYFGGLTDLFSGVLYLIILKLRYSKPGQSEAEKARFCLRPIRQLHFNRHHGYSDSYRSKAGTARH